MYDASLFHDMTVKGLGFHKMMATQKKTKNRVQSSKTKRRKRQNAFMNSIYTRCTLNSVTVK